jgi:hypothetical protein
MHRNRKAKFTRRNGRYFPAVAVCLALLALSLHAAPSNRVHLLPKFTPGETLRYQIETRTAENSKMETPIVDPEAASKSRQTVSLILRLDVLNPPPANNDPPGSVRIRATYEKSSATFESDAYAPAGSKIADQYKNLEGRSLEYTIEPDGEFSHIAGVDDLLTNRSIAENVHSWMNGLSSAARIPKEGIEVGQKWSSQRSIEGVALAGLIWRNQSTYMRNEPCNSTGAPPKSVTNAQPADANAPCAVIVTQFKINRTGDATPDDYARQNLNTSGTWTGSGGSLEFISLSTGILIHSTQESSQNIDVEIVSTRSGSKMHYTGHVENHSEISLLPATQPSADPQP